jgi:hypothetical protein
VCLCVSVRDFPVVEKGVFAQELALTAVCFSRYHRLTVSPGAVGCVQLCLVQLHFDERRWVRWYLSWHGTRYELLTPQVACLLARDSVHACEQMWRASLSLRASGGQQRRRSGTTDGNAPFCCVGIRPPSTHSHA